MLTLIYRKNGKFFIDQSQLKIESRKTEICNALYEAIYKEFMGASENSVYKSLTPLEKMQKLNDFAHDWLKNRGLE